MHRQASVLCTHCTAFRPDTLHVRTTSPFARLPIIAVAVPALFLHLLKWGSSKGPIHKETVPIHLRAAVENPARLEELPLHSWHAKACRDLHPNCVASCTRKITPREANLIHLLIRLRCLPRPIESRMWLYFLWCKKMTTQISYTTPYWFLLQEASKVQHLATPEFQPSCCFANSLLLPPPTVAPLREQARPIARSCLYCCWCWCHL